MTMMKLRTRTGRFFFWISAMAFVTAGTGAAGPEGLDVPGLRQPVEILRDTWGIAHIYAQNQDDLFFAQGYNVASARLFQLEIWRRQATGTVAEILGKKELDRDIGIRLLKFRGDLKAEMDFYHPQGQKIVASFTAGINASIDRVLRDPSLLPLEFRLLGIRPGHWTPEVVVSRHNGLFRNVGDEIALARALRVLPGEKLRELLDLHPGNPELRFADGLRANLLTDRILKIYRAARAPVTFDRGDVGDPADRPADGRTLAGSNNWAVSGRRTESGFPLLANDPHRALQIPSLRYWVHLIAPGWNVVGGGEPALPGVSIGHNDYGAWGLTIFSTDQEDLYVYDTKPGDPDLYRFRERWERMNVIREDIPVKGETPFRAVLKYTVHGPVLYEDVQNHKAYALRAAWLETGCAPYLASLRMDQSRGWPEFRAAAFLNRAPSENMVWADRAGDIGWQVTGLAPLRKNWLGLLPVPGDGRFEWAGYVPPQELPSAFNPDSEFVASANQDNVPAGFPYPLGFSWAEPFRYDRIREFLGGKPKVGLADMTALQRDVLSLPARELAALAADLHPADPDLRTVLAVFQKWDFRLTPDSAAAAVSAAWLKILQAKINRLFFPPALQDFHPGQSLSRVLQWLKFPDVRFGADPVSGRDRILLESLAEAVDLLKKRFGSGLSSWRYGDEKYHYVRLRHPLSGAVDERLRARLDLGPSPRGGDANTVDATGSENIQTAGATFRIVCDLSDWDRSLGSNMPGQSGDPGSPHYSDLYRMGAEGRYFPIAFTRRAVEAAAEKTVLLRPALK